MAHSIIRVQILNVGKTVETVLMSLFVNKHHDKSWCSINKNWLNTTIYCGVSFQNKLM